MCDVLGRDSKAYCVGTKPVGLLGDCALVDLHDLVGVIEGGRDQVEPCFEVNDFLAEAWAVVGGWAVRFVAVGAAAAARGVLWVGAA